MDEGKKNNAYVGYSGISDIKAFSKKFNEFFSNRKKKINNLSHFVLPEIDEARKIFEEKIGRKVSWCISNIDKAEIFHESFEHNRAIDRFQYAHRKWLDELAAARQPLSKIKPEDIEDPTFEQIEALMEAEKEEGADRWLKRKNRKEAFKREKPILSRDCDERAKRDEPERLERLKKTQERRDHLRSMLKSK